MFRGTFEKSESGTFLVPLNSKAGHFLRGSGKQRKRSLGIKMLEPGVATCTPTIKVSRNVTTKVKSFVEATDGTSMCSELQVIKKNSSTFPLLRKKRGNLSSSAVRRTSALVFIATSTIAQYRGSKWSE